MKVVIGIAGWFFGLAVLAAQGAGISGVALENPSRDFAIDPETGVVAAVESEKDTVRFYPEATNGSVKDSSAVAVGKGPVGIIFKKFEDKRYFVVLCHGAKSAVLIDGATLKVTGEIKLSGADPRKIIASSNAEDPYVYIATMGEGSDPYGTRAIDFRVMKDLELAGLKNHFDLQRNGAAISGDGRTAYGHIFLRGCWIGRITAQNPGKAPTFGEMRVVPEKEEIFPDPYGEMMAAGREVYSADMKTRLGTVDATVLSFLAGKPYIVIGSLPEPGTVAASGPMPQTGPGETISLASRNTFKTIGHVELPTRPAGPLSKTNSTFRSGSVNFSFVQRVLEDTKHGHVLVCDGTAIRAVAIKDFGAPEEPFLGATLEGSTQLAAGKAASWRLVQRDITQNVEIRSGPAGMKLQGDRIMWTPSERDIGDVKVEFRYSKGPAAITREMVFTVGQTGG
jgi:hypothetical protein